jgi:hypothetical protein
LEIEFLDKKTNIKEYLIKIYDNSNKIIQLLTENINTNKILPKVIISESVVISKIEINIIKTFDKNPPIHVKISIKGYQNIGCEPTKITSHQSSTKSTSKIPTTEIFSTLTSKPEPVTSNKPTFIVTTTPIFFTSSSSTAPSTIFSKSSSTSSLQSTFFSSQLSTTTNVQSSTISYLTVITSQGPINPSKSTYTYGTNSTHNSFPTTSLTRSSTYSSIHFSTETRIN